MSPEVESNMRLAIVSDSVLPWNQGGKETRYAGYVYDLAKTGIQPTVYTMKWWDGKTNPVINGVEFKSISPKYNMYNSQGVRSIAQGILFSLSTIRLLFAKGIDVIEADQIPYIQIFPLWLIARIRRIPLVVTWHEYWGKDYWRQYLPGLKGSIGSLVESFVIRLPNQIITVSDEVTGKVIEALGSPKKVLQINSGLSYSEMDKIRVDKSSNTILYVGRLIEHKRVDVLIEAFRKLVSQKQFQNFQLKIVGVGPEEQNLKTLAEGLANCIFSGELSSTSRVWEVIKEATVLVLPSEREGFGLVVAESLALGTPVITSNNLNNAARHLAIQQESHALFESGDVNDLEKSLSNLLNDLPDSQKVTEHFRKTSRIFNWFTVTGLYSAMLKNVVKNER